MPDTSSNPFIEARNAGLSPIPVDTKTKRPLVAWKQYQEHIADFDELTEWNGSNIGIVCGRVSGRLICVDIEGRCLTTMGFKALSDRLDDEHLYKLFEAMIWGYSELTPNGGMHILVRIEGNGPCEGNEKLAMTADNQVLIETRGEGGYTIVAPSMNGGVPGWRLYAGSLDTILFLTSEEWRAVKAVFSSLDERPPPSPPPPPPPRTPTPSIWRLSEDWFDDEVATLPPIETVLEDHGWQRTGSSDSYGEHWTRPGKDPREGHSASLNHDSRRLWVHSTNAAPLPPGVSLDNLDVILCYELGRMPTRQERTDYIVARRKGRQPAAPAERRQAAGQAADTPPATPSLNLPDEFWNSRKYLSHIRTAALARRLSPDAVWEAIKCFYAATIPWNHRLPNDGTMDYMSIIVGNSGTGKSSAKQEAYNLLEGIRDIDPLVWFPVPPGSGEGMTEFYLNKDRESENRYIRRGVGFYSDEGKWLLDVDKRTGNTTMQILKSAWSGELTGSVAATADRHRFLAPRDVRCTVLVAATPDVAADFMRRDLTDQGLPQRISWGWAPYPHDDDRPEHPGPLHVPLWRTTGSNIYTCELEPELAAMIDRSQMAQRRGEGDPHEGHATYAQLKTAAILAHLRHEMVITMSDWELAQLDWNMGISIREYLLRSQQQNFVDRDEAAGRSAATRKMAESSVYLERAVFSLVAKLRSSTDVLSSRDIKKHLSHFNRRHGLHYTEVITVAIERGLVRQAGGGHFVST